jgi:hypothetical protein
MKIQHNIQARTDRNIILANFMRERRKLKTSWVGNINDDYYHQVSLLRDKYQSILDHLKQIYRMGLRDIYDIQRDLIDTWNH